MASEGVEDPLRWGFLPASLLWAAASFYLVPTATPPALKATFALLNVAFVLAMPYLVPHPYRELDVFVRVCTGYLAMKILDLCVARVHHPPRLIALKGRAPETRLEHIHYAWRLSKETRYESFDISVVHSTSTEHEKPRSNDLVYHLVTYTTIPLLNYFLPQLAEVKILAVLLTISSVFSLGHALLRPSSRVPLFDTPFLAPTLTSFWRRRWHAIVLSPLTSLAFDPASKVGGRGAGVLAAFALSGLWHAWSVIPMGGYKLAWKVWMVFFVQGVGCLLEWAVWRKNQTLVRRLCGWAWSLGWCGWALRGWDERAQYGL